jgi:hypothetical protein
MSKNDFNYVIGCNPKSNYFHQSLKENSLIEVVDYSYVTHYINSFIEYKHLKFFRTTKTILKQQTTEVA